METKIIYIEGIGKVTFTRSKKAKYVNLVVRPFENLKVAVPDNISFTKAETVVQNKIDWIQDKLKKIKKLEKKHTYFDEQTSFKTHDHILEIKSHDSAKITITISQKKIHIKYPRTMDVSSTEIQDAIRYGIERALRIEAKEYIPLRTSQLAKKFGFSYRSIFFKNAKTRWGSCSNKDNLNFNIHLMRLPDHLIDYVILHELAHTIEKNHSKKFWSLLDRLAGNAKSFDKELKNYKIQIF